MTTRDYLKAYKVITQIMKEEQMTMDTSFRRVQYWLSNKICDNISDEELV